MLEIGWAMREDSPDLWQRGLRTGAEGYVIMGGKGSPTIRGACWMVQSLPVNFFSPSQEHFSALAHLLLRAMGRGLYLQVTGTEPEKVFAYLNIMRILIGHSPA